MTGIVAAWAAELESDLKAFADRRTTVSIDVIGSNIRAGWREGRRQRNEVFLVDDDDRLMWVPEGGPPVPYRAFLGSDAMADLEVLAEAITLKYEPIQAFVPPDATVEVATDDREEIEAALAPTSALMKTTLGARGGLTTVYFLKGDAGAGKTTLLEQLAAHQANAYLRDPRAAGFLFLNVSAQGRLLSNLPDALAAETQDLSARFRNEAVAVLARRSLLIPIIDGFDELLGTAGYTDAFSSLQALLRDLGGRGVLVVSARSSFYEAEFVQRGQAFDESAYKVAPFSLHPWSDAKLKEYVRRASPDGRGDRYVAMLDDVSAGDLDLLHRPFFARAFPEYARRREEGAGVGPILDHLIEDYIQREALKVTDAAGAPLLEADAHRQIFEEAAEQMWLAGDRKLSTDDLRTVAEAIAEAAGLNQADTDQFRNKITSYAGFTLDENRDAFGFEHEVYFDFFLARAGARQMEAGRLGTFFDGGLLSQRVLGGMVTIGAEDVALSAVEALQPSAAQANRRQNAGGLVASMAHREPVVDRILAGVDFVGEDLSGCKFVRCEFVQCTFFGTDLRATEFSGCISRGSTFTSVEIDGETRLEITGVDVFKDVSSVVDFEADAELFEPARLAERLAAAGLSAQVIEHTEPPAMGPRAASTAALIELMSRRFRRTTLIAEDDDRGASKIFDHPEWAVAQGLLEQYGLIKIGTRPSSGRRKEFVRPSVSFRELLSESRFRAEGAETPMQLFWRDVWALDD